MPRIGKDDGACMVFELYLNVFNTVDFEWAIVLHNFKQQQNQYFIFEIVMHPRKVLHFVFR